MDSFCKLLLLSSIILACSNFASSDVMTTLTLQDIVQKTISQNFEIKASYNDFLASQKARWEAVSTYLPQASFQSSSQKTMSNRFTTSLRNAGFAGDVYSNKFQVSQLIFDRSVLGGIFLSRLKEESAQWQWQGQRQQILLQSIGLFLEILRSQEIINVQEQKIILADKQFFSAQSQFEVGYRTRTEVSQAELTKASAMRDRNVARLTRNRVQIALNRLLGDPVNKDHEYSSLYLTNLAPSDPNFLSLPQGENSYQIADQKNPALQVSKNLVKQYEEAIAMAKGEYMPRLSTSGSWGYYDTGKLDLRDEEWNIQVAVEIPIFEGGRRVAKVSRTKEQYKAASNRYQDTQQKIYAQIEDSLSIMAEEQENYTLATHSVVVGQRNYDDHFNLYKEGMIEQIQVTQALTDLVEAKKNVVIARYNFLQGLLQFKSSLGLLPTRPSVYETNEWLTFAQDQAEKSDDKQ